MDDVLLDRQAAARTVAALDLETENRVLAEHWLSLWQGDVLPQRSALHPAKLKRYLPNIILFNVVPDASVTVRLAGTRFNHILGAELTGKDWIAATPEHHRPLRLKLFSTIARGALMVDHRLVAMATGEDMVVEEILLPFAAEANGVHPVLVHVNLKATQYLKIKSVKQVLGDPVDFKIVPLAAAEPVG
ncbi:MAG TPA: PAS domain-containing protein [Rhizomicrobium sp.]